MLFHTFISQQERRAFGGSAFVEIQFCGLPYKTELERIVELESIKHWQDESLYISDIQRFEEEYTDVFIGGVFSNLKSGKLDVFGINYFKPELIETIITTALAVKPTDYGVLLEWLDRAKSYNGFYVLGV